MNKFLQSTKEHNLYGNCQMLSPDGKLMCRCDERKANWYLSRKLAKIISEEPVVFQLTFIPKGNGYYASHKFNSYFLSEKKNICCVCGSSSELTRHHCVPLLYRRYFPEHIKTHNSHDVVLLCVDCHEKYELEAEKLKQSMAVEFNAPLRGCYYNAHSVVDNNILAIRYNYIASLAQNIVKHNNKIPAAKLSAMRDKINAFFNRVVDLSEYISLKPVSQKKAECVAGITHITHGKMVVEKCNPEDFIKRWREHFIKTMQPKFLPDYWDVENPISKID